VNDPSTPEPSATDQPASTPDLAALQRRYPDWHVRRGTGTDPLGYSASREGTLITAPNLTRLADRLANADQPSPVPAGPADDEGGDRPPAILITGPPGWLSGPCYDQDGLDVLAPFTGRWQIDVQPATAPVWSALRQRGTETRVLIAFTPADLAAKLTAAEAEEQRPAPGGSPDAA